MPLVDLTTQHNSTQESTDFQDIKNTLSISKKIEEALNEDNNTKTLDFLTKINWNNF